MIKSLLLTIIFVSFGQAKSAKTDKKSLKSSNKPLLVHQLKNKTFAAVKNRWTLAKLLKNKISKADYQFFLSKNRQLNIKLNHQLKTKFIPSKRAFKIGDNKNLFFVAKNNKYIKYKNKIFKYNKLDSFKDNYMAIEKILNNKTSSLFSILNQILFNKAHAQSYEEGAESASMDLLMLLSYLEFYGNGESHYDTLLYIAENDPEAYAIIMRLYNSNGNKAIQSITCDNEYRMTITFKDGTTTAVNWNGVQGSGAKAEVTENSNGNWNPISLDGDKNTHALNGQYFFCGMMGDSNTYNGGGPSSNQLAVISSLNEMVAPQDYGYDGGTTETEGSNSLD